jgi:hypothetical protein
MGNWLLEMEDDSCLGSGVECTILYAPKRIGNIIPRYLAVLHMTLIQNFISKKITVEHMLGFVPKPLY